LLGAKDLVSSCSLSGWIYGAGFTRVIQRGCCTESLP